MSLTIFTLYLICRFIDDFFFDSRDEKEKYIEIKFWLHQYRPEKKPYKKCQIKCQLNALFKKKNCLLNILLAKTANKGNNINKLIMQNNI